ncbi:MAG TPA: ankyrin repeat domain-containing protein [Bacillaceae bacterium]|nr:ankyrin repeat domain-containing protein [Bacillaceae bacterium]
MGRIKFYRTGEFARRAGVTKRALRYYDRIGLLHPSYRTETDHRLYSDEDFIKLQQIVTLKFIGFSLDQIKHIITAKGVDVESLLRMQREWLEGKLQDTQLAISAIKEAERAVQFGEKDYLFEKIQNIIGVIEMQSNRNWLNEFLEAAVSGRVDKANTILLANPEIEDLNIYSAVVLGKADTVRSMLKTDPSLAIQQGGPKQWEPILYLAYSSYLRDTENSDRFAETARILLEAGANPNAFYIVNGPFEQRFSALYGVIGIANNDKVAELLLEAGANPNDGESFYHAVEFHNTKSLDLLYKYGVDINGGNAFFHKLDYEDPEGILWFLENGVDLNITIGNGNTPLHWAIYRRRSIETIKLIIEYGANINAERSDNKTPYAIAIRFGYLEAAELLREKGANVEIDIIDQFLGACATEDKVKADLIFQENPNLLSNLTQADKEMLIEFAQLNMKETVRMLLHYGFDKQTKMFGGTALHYATWLGMADMVNLLLEYGFSVEEKNGYGGTALGSAIHGSIHSNADGDFGAVVKALIDAGAEVPAKADGSKEVFKILLEHGAEE